MEDQTKYSNNIKYFWAAIAILLLLSGGLGYLYLQEKAQNELSADKLTDQLTAQIVANSKLDSMSRELNFKINEVKSLGGNINSLLKIKANLEADKKLINGKNSVIGKEFASKLKSYENILAQKDQEIIQLREKNGLLTTENQSLNNENTGLKTEKQRLADSITTFAAKNRELSDKVTLASALRAETINVYAISTKGKEREATNINARRVDKIRISFHLVDNPLAKQEEKEIYVRLLEPNGAIIADMATGSGVFKYNNQEVIYTTLKKEFYTNTHQLIDILYARGQAYRQGKYGIELYCEGHKIGQGTFDVK